ncbi:MAG TPA: BON domain-containing protein [Rhizomicrobium sp.]|nr:BON domain-containing protein [Rhizomicrobium sp.]
MTDSSLRQDILDELDFEPRVNATHIGVAVNNGVVTLSGHVGSYAEKVAAETAVKRVKGVRAIAEEIEVRYPFDKKTADDEIAGRAANILRWNSAVPADSIQVKVQDGWIALSGTVDWDFQRKAAESEVRKLSGVAGVINEITIKPRVAPTDIQRKIESALLRNAEVEAQNIKVSVLDYGHVSLKGRVHGWQEREMVKNAAWSVPGVVAVEDFLSIG